MKNLLITLGTEIVRGLLAAQAGDRSSIFSALFPAPAAAAPEPAPLPDFAYLTRSAKRLAALLAAAFLSSLLFVGGLLMALFSAAQSVDLVGYLVFSRSFGTGFFLTLAAGAGLLVCRRKLRSFEFSFEHFFRHTHPAGASSVPPEAYAPGADLLVPETAPRASDSDALNPAFARTGIAPEVLGGKLRPSSEQMAG